MKKQLTNERAAQMCADLLDSGLLDIIGIVGYLSAVNYMALRDAVEPFLDQRNRLIAEYGDAKTDEGGNIVDYVVSPTSPRFAEFIEKHKAIADLTVEVDVKPIKESEAVNVISGKQLLAVPWLFETENESEVSDERSDA